MLGLPIHDPLYPSPVGAHLGALKGKFARTCAAVAALADTQSAHALMRSWQGPAKVQYALRTLHGGRRGGRHCDPAGHLGCCGGHARVRCSVGASHTAAE